MLIWFFLASFGSALEQALCSKENTGSVTTNNVWMSNGLCSNFCSQYRYGIVQGENCWCSNTAPDDTSDLGNCDTTCPGYGYEKCGGDGYYGYISLSGNSDGSESSSSSVDQSSTADDSTSSSTASSESSSSSETSSSETPSSEYTYAGANSQVSSSEMEEVSTTTGSSSSSTSDTSSSSSSSSTPSSSSSSSSSTSLSSSSATSSSSPIATTSSSSASSSSTSISSESSSPASISSSPDSTSTSSSLSPPLAISTSSFLSAAPGSGIYTALVTTMIKTTITYTPAPSATEINKSSPSSAATDSHKHSSSFFDHKGRVAAVFSVVGIVSLALILLLIFILRKTYLNKHKGPIAIESDTDSFEKPVIIGTLPNNPTPTGPPASGSAKKASVFSLHRKSHSVPTAVQRPPPLSDMVMVDQRLDPHSELYNNSNHSTRSLSDQVDYSRKVLRVANPDA